MLRPFQSAASPFVRLDSAIGRLRDRIGVAAQEAVTGRFQDLSARLNGKIGAAMLQQMSLEDIERSRDRIALRESRLELAQNSLSSIQVGVSGLAAQTQAALASEDAGLLNAAALDARTALEDAFSALNTSHSDRYLFAGDATATRPFADVSDVLEDIKQIAANSIDAQDFTTQLEDYFESPTGGWLMNGYLGAQTASDPDAVTGADPAITQLVSGLGVIAALGEEPAASFLTGNPQLVEQAASSLAAGEGDLTQMRVRLGVSQGRLEREARSLDAEETALSAAFNEMTARDQYEAASELSELETNLEAAYLLTSRLSNLNLTNYLR